MGLSILLDILFPKFCLGCGTLGRYICQRCEKTINFYQPQTCPYCERESLHGLTHPRCKTPWGLDGMYVLAHYDGLIKEVVHRVKYQGQFALYTDIADLIGKRFHGHYQFDYFVPVPLAPKREKERGFNQAAKFALAISMYVTRHDRYRQHTSIIQLLRRTRETKPQFELKYEDRQKNVAGAFTVAYNLTANNLSRYSFCLVDDVATTGATIFECAKVLKRAGGDKVYAITVARGG